MIYKFILTILISMYLNTLVAAPFVTPLGSLPGNQQAVEKMVEQYNTKPDEYEMIITTCTYQEAQLGRRTTENPAIIAWAPITDIECHRNSKSGENI